MGRTAERLSPPDRIVVIGVGNPLRGDDGVGAAVVDVLAADGTVTDAVLVPPTAQNQGAIEADVKHAVRARLAVGPPAEDAELAALSERAIRNHDPCISCSAHFLRPFVER